MSEKIISNIIKAIIWIGLIVIIFSPLYVSSKVFFPFIVTKTIVFYIVVEIMLLAFLYLAWRDGAYKIKINKVIILFFIYIVLILISSILGDNFYRSFWSNNERSEGIFLMLHLFLLLFVLSGFFRKFKEWLYIFDLSFFAGLLVSLVALGQFLQLPWLLASSSGVRLAGTIGNAGYMAGYLVFTIFFGLLLLFKRKNIYLRIYYVVFIVLMVFIVLNTFTRGGMLALFFTGLVFALYLLFYYFQDKRLKIAGLIVILLSVSFFAFTVVNKNSDFIKNSQILGRIASIPHDLNIFSKESRSPTAENRLMTWNSAWQGFKERPVFGWGQENFYQPFDKYFNPGIYRKEGSVVWFDRAHNIIFDRLITGGILGLFVYLLFLFLPFVYLWRYYLTREKKNRYFIPMIFSLIILAYFIQNLFIFEALVIYVPLFLILAFAGLFDGGYRWKWITNYNVSKYLFILWLLLILPVMYLGTIRPLSANMDLTVVLGPSDFSLEQRFNLFKNVLAQNTYGNQEYRRQLFAFLESSKQGLNNQIQQNPQSQNALMTKYGPVITEMAEYTDKEIQKQLEENPHSTANYLLAMRFNNFIFNNIEKINIIEKNTELFQQLEKISPNRQHIHLEMGYSYFYVASDFAATGQDDIAKSYYDLAIDRFKFASELNKRNLETYKQLSNILIFAKENNQMQELWDDLYEVRDGIYSGFYEDRMIIFFGQLINSAINAENYEIIKFFADQLIEIDPDNPNHYVSLALAHAYLGEDDKAIEIAQMVMEFGGGYEEQSAEFINKVRNGEFSDHESTN